MSIRQDLDRLYTLQNTLIAQTREECQELLEEIQTARHPHGTPRKNYAGMTTTPPARYWAHLHYKGVWF